MRSAMINIERATKNYSVGMPIWQIAQIENVNRKTVSNILKGAGVEIIPSRGKRKHPSISEDGKRIYAEAENFLSGKRAPLSTGEIAVLLNSIDELAPNKISVVHQQERKTDV